MDFKQLFLSFDGRINRQPFWIGVVILFIVNVAASAIFAVWLAGIIQLVLIYPSLAVSVKRCHDRDKSGWWCLLLLIPVVGFIWWVIDLGILEGTDGENQYGPNPLAT